MNRTRTALRITAFIVFLASIISGIRFGFGFGHLYSPGPGAWLSFNWGTALAFWFGGLLVGMFFLFLLEHLALLNRIAVHAENAKPITADDVAKTESSKTDI